MTPRTFESAGKPVTPSAEATAVVKNRKTPSPMAKPPSPTNLASARKTPSPTIFSRSGGRSPNNGQLVSPTFGKGAAPPSARRAQHRSPDPAEPVSPPQRPRSPGIHKFPRSPKQTVRSKSSMSHHELRDRAGRRQRRDALDHDDVEEKHAMQAPDRKPSATVGTQTDPVCEHGTPFTSLVSNLAQTSRPSPCEPSDDRFLEKLAKIQGELAMAVCSGMELIAERGAMSAPSGSVGGGCGAAGDTTPCASVEPGTAAAAAGKWDEADPAAETARASSGVREMGAGAVDKPAAAAPAMAAAEFASHGSDSECDEVRSLSLSEEGPIYSRLCRWRDAMRAPDPIAMISEGQHCAIDAEEEEEFERSVGSGTSAATTRIAGGAGHAGSPSGKPSASTQEDALSELLSPILSKISNRLEILPEIAAGWTERAAPCLIGASQPRPATMVQATKVKALHSTEWPAARVDGDALPLSHVRLAPSSRADHTHSRPGAA